MLYTICIAIVVITAILLILAVLVQSPKSGMAANFGASNQVIGERQTADALEKATWVMAAIILTFSLMATVVMDGSSITGKSSIGNDRNAIFQQQSTSAAAEQPSENN